MNTNDPNYPLLKSFFVQSYEWQATIDMLYKKHNLTEEVKDYIDSIVSIPYSDFVEYVINQSAKSYVLEDIPQHSNFDDASWNYCIAFKNNGYKQLSKNADIGKILNSDEKKEGAHSKYGETATKLAIMFGFAYRTETGSTDITAVGRVITEFDEDVCIKFRKRAILRNPFFACIVQDLSKDDVNIYKYLKPIPSESTKGRRQSNVSKMIQEIKDEFLNSNSTNITLHDYIYAPITVIQNVSNLAPSKYSNQVIFYGAPGSGKSRIVNKEIHNHIFYRTTFHPETDYASFVGSYKPTMEDGKIVYDFIPQIFLKAYFKAWNLLLAGKKDRVYLVIEEINRGNCAQIFGDLFQLLDRNREGWSDYVINADTDIEKIIIDRDNSDEPLIDDLEQYQEKIESLVSDENSKEIDKESILLMLPPNLSIFCTMNTSDQSLFPMDSAFKRRWEWIYVPINYTDASTMTIESFADGWEINWKDLISVLNEKIYAVTNRTDKQLGNRFVRPNEMNRISHSQLVNKVIFYLWTEIYKDMESSDKNNIFPLRDKEYIAFEKMFTMVGDEVIVNEDNLEFFLESILPGKYKDHLERKNNLTNMVSPQNEDNQDGNLSSETSIEEKDE